MAPIQVESRYLSPDIVKGYLSPLSEDQRMGVLESRRAVQDIVDKYKEPTRSKDSKMRRFFSGLRQDKEQLQSGNLLVVVNIPAAVQKSELSLVSNWLRLVSTKTDSQEKRRFLDRIDNDKIQEVYARTIDKPLDRLEFLLNIEMPTQLGNIAETRDVLRAICEHTGVCLDILDNTLMNFVSDIPSLVVLDARSPDISLKVASGLPSNVAVRCRNANEIFSAIKILEHIAQPTLYPTVSHDGLPICIHTTGNPDTFLALNYTPEVEDEVVRLVTRGIKMPKIMLKIAIEDLALFCDTWQDSILPTFVIGVEVDCSCVRFASYFNSQAQEEYRTERNVLGTMFSPMEPEAPPSKLSWIKTLFRSSKEKRGGAGNEAAVDELTAASKEITDGISKFYSFLNYLHTAFNEQVN